MQRQKNIEILPIHHLEGHILAPGLEDKDVPPPYLCLLVSGGHTQIIDCKSYGDYTIIGETIDDAVGKHLIKLVSCSILNILVDQKFQNWLIVAILVGLNTSRALSKDRNYNFSFSGLKTSVLYTVNDSEESDYADIAASFQKL